MILTTKAENEHYYEVTWRARGQSQNQVVKHNDEAAAIREASRLLDLLPAAEWEGFGCFSPIVRLVCKMVMFP